MYIELFSVKILPKWWLIFKKKFFLLDELNFRDPVGILILCLKRPKHITWMALWYVCVLGTGLGVGGPMGGGVPISWCVNLSFLRSVSWSRCVCVGDQAGQVGAARAPSIAVCGHWPWPAWVNSVSPSVRSRAAVLCAGQGRVWRSFRKTLGTWKSAAYRESEW